MHWLSNYKKWGFVLFGIGLIGAGLGTRQIVSWYGTGMSPYSMMGKGYGDDLDYDMELYRFQNARQVGEIGSPLGIALLTGGLVVALYGLIRNPSGPSTFAAVGIEFTNERHPLKE